jgi:outer membrane protein insertion porin family
MAIRQWARLGGIASAVVSVVWLLQAALCLGADLSPLPGVGDTVDRPPISQVRVVMVRQTAEAQELIRLAKSLITIEPGQRLTAAALQMNLKALETSGRFSSIHVETHQEGAAWILVFQLTPYRLIKRIDLEGLYPLFEKDVRNVMTIFVGDIYKSREMGLQQRLVSGYLKQEGYIAPRVTAVAQLDPDDGHYTITLHLKKGPFREIRHLTITGNRAFSNTTIQRRARYGNHLFSIAERRFAEVHFKENIKSLVEFYRHKGYADVNIDYTLFKSTDPRQVDIHLVVSEGPRYRVEFQGNERFWDMTLKKDLVLKEIGNRNGIGVRRSIRNILQRYHQAGYGNVNIKTVDMNTAARRTITLEIDEGPCTLVKDLVIVGNHGLAEAEIRRQILTRPPEKLHKGLFVPEVLEQDLVSLRSLYLQHGFLDAKLDQKVTFSPDQRQASVEIHIAEGPQTRVTAVKINGITATETDQAMASLTLTPGQPFRRYMVTSDENSLSALISEKGYPHVTVVSHVTFSEDRTGAAITYKVDPGPRVTFGGIFVSGNFQTREATIAQEMPIKRGQPFSLRKTLEGQRRIRDMDIFNTVQFKTLGLEDKAKTVTLLAEVEEKKPYFFQVGAGYESDQGVYGSTRIGDHNLFGLNKYLWTGARVSETGYRVESGLSEPRLFGTDISANWGGFVEELEEFNQTFGTRALGASVIFERDWVEFVKTTLAFRYEYRNQYATDGVADQSSAAFDPRSIWVTTPTVRYDTSDSFVRPTQGIISEAAVDISHGLSNSLDNFLKYHLDLRFYHTAIKPLTIALRGMAGYIDHYGKSAEVPLDQLFYLGGTADVRGFDENLLRFNQNGDPLGGEMVLLGSVELRFNLGMNFELPLFYDVGSITEALEPDGSDPARASAGLGLRYHTPIGPIGLVYGHKLDRKSGESAGRVHFSIGYTF